jgi:hypothetical protein
MRHTFREIGNRANERRASRQVMLKTVFLLFGCSLFAAITGCGNSLLPIHQPSDWMLDVHIFPDRHHGCRIMIWSTAECRLTQYEDYHDIATTNLQLKAEQLADLYACATRTLRALSDSRRPIKAPETGDKNCPYVGLYLSFARMRVSGEDPLSRSLGIPDEYDAFIHLLGIVIPGGWERVLPQDRKSLAP